MSDDTVTLKTAMIPVVIEVEGHADEYAVDPIEAYDAIERSQTQHGLGNIEVARDIQKWLATKLAVDANLFTLESCLEFSDVVVGYVDAVAEERKKKVSRIVASLLVTPESPETSEDGQTTTSKPGSETIPECEPGSTGAT